MPRGDLLSNRTDFVRITLQRALVSAALLLALAARIEGAGTGTIVVRSVDAHGDPLAGTRAEATTSVLPGRVVAVTGASGVAVLGLLPPGRYEVTATHPDGTRQSWQMQLSQGDRVELADLATLRVEEEVEVRAEGLTGASEAGITATMVTLGDVERIPVGRDYRAYAQLVPGVTVVPNSGGLETRYEPASKAGNFYHDRGALLGSRDNTYLLDGFNITGMGSGTGDYTFPNEVILEEGVVTSRVPVDLPGGAGFVANVVTKAGGAEFAGSLNFFLQKPWMYESFTTQDPRLRAVLQDRYDGGATLGGPVLKERLWLFAAVQERSSSDPVELSPSASPTPVSSVYRLLRRNVFLKLTGRPSDSDSLALSTFGEDRETSGTRDVNVPLNRYGREESESLLASLSYQRLLSATSLLEARAGTFREVTTGVPEHPGAGPSNTILFEPGRTVPAYMRDLGSSGGGGEGTNHKLQGDLSGSVLLDWYGSHQLKAGIGFLRWEEQNKSRPAFPGVLTSIDPGLVGLTFDQARDLTFLPSSELDVILRAIQERPSSAAFAAADANHDGAVTAEELGALTFASTSGNSGGVNFMRNQLLHAGTNNVYSENRVLFLQDEWRSGRWTATAGVRLERLSYTASDGSTILEMAPAFYPRLGLAFDPGGDGRQRVSLAYGEYADPLLTPMIRFAGNLSGSIYADQVFVGSEWFTYRTRGSAILNHDAGFAPNLENEKEREYQLAYAADLGHRLSVLGQAWYRRDYNLIEDYDPGVYFNPAVAGDLTLTPGQFGYPASGPTGVNYFLGNLVGGRRHAWGLDLALQRAFGDNWSSSLQYSYKRAMGNSNSNAAADLQGDFLALDPRQPYMYGTLPGTVAHQVKWFGSWLTPIGVELGWLYYWNSGAAFTEADIFRPASHAIYYNHQLPDGQWVRMGGETHPAYDQLDLRLKLVVGLGAGLALDLFSTS